MSCRRNRPVNLRRRMPRTLVAASTLVLAAALLAPARPAAASEARCHELVQDKIAWNYEGAKRWNPDNVRRLCRGTSNEAQPPRCFQRAMHGGINWGGGTRWQWENAIDLCEGTNDAAATIACFQRHVAAGRGWQEAIRSCESTPEALCADLVQGKIAWDYQGNTRWNPSNVERLCRGTSDAPQPGRCFDRVMHGNIDWGGGTRWEWENAIDLCEGSGDAGATISCFQRTLARGGGWARAIRACEAR